MNEPGHFHKRKLPHLVSSNGTYFVTTRLAGVIPKAIIDRYLNEKRFIDDELSRFAFTEDDIRSEKLKDFHRKWFIEYDRVMDSSKDGPSWLADPDVASMVYESFLHRNGKSLDLHALCVMSNHVHSVFKPLPSDDDRNLQYQGPDRRLSAILMSLKGFTARRANKHLCRIGAFWDAESYDHLVRNDTELKRVIKYTINNPVKAGLVSNWKDWKWTYLSDEFKSQFE